DVHCRNAEILRSDSDQLQKRLQAAQRAERIGGVQLRPDWSHIQGVRFVLAKILDGLAFVVRRDFERWRPAALIRAKNDHSGLPLNFPLESHAGSIKPRLAISGEKRDETPRHFP